MLKKYSRLVFLLVIIGTIILLNTRNQVVFSESQTIEEVMASATYIGTGGNHTCAVMTDGSVKCWGYNYYGQLGNGTNSGSYIPVDVVGLDQTVTSISLGKGHTCAIMTDGSVKCWGLNNFGQLGNGTNTDSNIPVDVIDLNQQVISVSASDFYHTCAVLIDGSAKCWGTNLYGQLGNEDNNTSYVPVNVVGLDQEVISIATGSVHSCALMVDRSVKCWGAGASGQLGNGTNTGSNIPVNVIGLNQAVTALSLSKFHTCTLMANGSAKCWGDNEYGQLGNGTNTDSNIPINVVGLDQVVNSIGSGYFHGCALMVDESVKCWGNNYYGQLGNGTNTDSNVPVGVISLDSPITPISAGGMHTCIRMIDKSVKCWGNNGFGQLGNETNTSSNIPVDVVGFGFTTPECDSLNDTDGDAIPDGWEVCGFDHNGDGTIDVDLPAMGANWLHKDVFLEIDYMVLRPFRNFHPSDDTIGIMVDAYNNAPIQNPDGTSGIHLHVDYGKSSPLTWGTASTWESLSESNELPYDLFIFGNGQWSDYFDKMQFSNVRQNIFHYAIFGEFMAPSKLGAGGYSLGIESQYLAIALDIIYSPQEIGGITMHELGHNLGLRHGGDDDNNFKPNYLSIMNDSFTKSGLVVNGQSGNYRYSEFTLETLDETNLDETIGITSVNQGDYSSYKSVYYCGNQMNLADIESPVDWNCNGNETETNIVADINKSGIDILDSQNDWENLVFDGGCIGYIGSCEIPTTNIQQKVNLNQSNPEFETFPDVYVPYRIEMSLGASYEINAALETTIPITVTNSGTEISTVMLSYETDSTVFDLNNLPSVVSLTAGENYIINIVVLANIQDINYESLHISAVISENNKWTGDAYIEIKKESSTVYLPLVIR